jgi:hypothetical protein
MNSVLRVGDLAERLSQGILLSIGLMGPIGPIRRMGSMMKADRNRYGTLSVFVHSSVFRAQGSRYATTGLTWEVAVRSVSWRHPMSSWGRGN